MLKNIILSVLFILCFNFTTKAQFTIDKDTLSAYGPASEFEIVAYTKLRNTTSDTDVIVWNRIDNTLQANWASAVCDIILCHGETVDQAEFTLLPNKVGDISFHFYPDNNKGNGKMVVRFSRKSNPSTYIDVVINAQAWGLGINNVKNNLFKVVPNPATSSILIGSESINEGTFEIFNILGTKVMGDHFISANKIDVSSLSRGVYMITIRNGNTVASSKLVIE